MRFRLRTLLIPSFAFVGAFIGSWILAPYYRGPGDPSGQSVGAAFGLAYGMAAGVLLRVAAPIVFRSS